MESKYEVGFSDEAWKDLEKLTKTERIKVLSKLSKLSTEPSNNIKSLKGSFGGYFRLRVGKIRVVFEKLEKTNKMLVNYIGFRGSIYK